MSVAAPAPRQDKVWCVLDVVRWTTERFSARGLATPRLDAELLAAHAFGLSRVELYTQFDRPLRPEELDAFRDLVKRRQAGEPVAYLSGKKEFWSLALAVDRRVLVPRPDTETLVEEALERLPEDAAIRVVDVGTGSGAIAVVLATSRPKAVVFATDVSTDALAVATANARRLGAAITFRQGDLLRAMEGEAPFDLIVANLPYVPSGDLPGLAPDLASEPALALDGGCDGLDVVRRLVAQAPRHLCPGGWLMLEIGAGQAAATIDLLQVAGFGEVGTRRDLGAIERVVRGRMGTVDKEAS